MVHEKSAPQFNFTSSAPVLFFPSEQETPGGSQEKPRRRKKPKTPEPKVVGDSARENLGFQDDAAMEGDGVSTCTPLFVSSTGLSVWSLHLFTLSLLTEASLPWYSAGPFYFRPGLVASYFHLLLP